MMAPAAAILGSVLSFARADLAPGRFLTGDIQETPDAVTWGL